MATSLGLRKALDREEGRGPKGWGFAALAMAAAVGCGPEAGTFDLRIDFDGEPPSVGSGIFVEVRELRPGEEPALTSGRPLASSDPAPWDGSVLQLEVPSVPNGDRRFVVVEMRESIRSGESELLRYGLSLPFSLRAGENTVVEVLVRLRPPPATEDPSTVVVMGNADVQVFSRQPSITLRVRTDTGVIAEVSNFSTFPAERSDSGPDREPVTQRFVLDPSGAANATACQAEGGPACSYDLSWDLNRGLEDTCGWGEDPDSPNRQDTCPRRVYVRFVDGFGATSRFVSQDVILDTRSPSVSGPGTTVTPTSARAAAPIQVNLAFSEPIRLTLFELDGTTATATRTAPEPRLEDPVSSSFTYLIPRAEALGPDGRYPVRVAGQDRAGNRLPEVVAAELEVDTSTPTVREEQLAPLELGGPLTGQEDDDLLTLSFELSESIPDGQATLQVQYLGAGAPLSFDASACNQTIMSDGFIRWVCRRRLTEARANQASERVPVTIRVADGSGNVGEGAPQLVTLDYLPPDILPGQPPTVTPNPVQAGSSFRVTVVADEVLAPAEAGVELSWAGGGPTCTVVSGTVDSRVLSCPTTVGQSLNYRLGGVQLVDALGNERSIPLAVDVDVDGVPPVVQFADDLDPVRSGSAVNFSFTVDEAPFSRSILIGSTPASCGAYAAATGAIDCSIQATGPAGQFTILPITIQVSDRAGNRGSASGSLRVDNQAPAVASAAFSPAVAGRGDTVTLTLGMTEALDTSVPVVSVARTSGSGGSTPLNFSCNPPSGTTITCQASVTASTQVGRFALTSVRATDRLGNTAPMRPLPSGLGTLTVDTTDPQVSLTLPADRRFGPRRNRLSFSFNVSETVPAGGVAVTVAGQDVTGRCTLAPDGGGGLDGDCSGVVVAATTPGRETTETVAVRAIDAAGNAGEAPPETVTYDFEPPTVSSANVGPSLATAGSPAVATLVLSESVPSGPASVAFRSGASGTTINFACDPPTATSLTCRYDVVGSTPEESFVLQPVSLTDALGNQTASRPSSSTQFMVDRTPPAIRNLSLNASHRSAVNVLDGVFVDFNRVAVTFRLSEVPALGPSVTVAGQGASCPPRTAITPNTDVTCTYLLQGNELAGRGSQTSNESVVVQVQDAAGNVATDNLTVLIDFESPAANASFNPSVAGNGTVLALTLTPNETVAAGYEPVLLWDMNQAPRTFGAPMASGLSFLYPLTVNTGTGDGTFTLRQVRLRDEVGNTGVATLNPAPTLTVDAEAPEVVGLTVSPARARAGTTVEAGFEIRRDDIAPGQLEVTLLGQALTCTSTNNFAQGVDITCRSVPLTAPTPPSTTAESVIVRATDAAGNPVQESANLILDFEPPGVARAGVQYRTGADNVLNRVEVATGADGVGEPGGTEVFVNVTFDEEIDTTAFTPTLVARRGATNMAFALVAPLAPVVTSAEFSATISKALHPDGIYVPEVSMEDRAGNRSSGLTISTATIAVDSTPKTLVVQQAQVSYIRSPVGNAAAEVLLDQANNPVFTIPAGVAYFELGPPDGLDAEDSLPGSTFSLAGADIRQIRAWADDDRQILRGSATPNSQSGRWPRADLRLNNADSPRVYVTGVDEAGNESRPVAIESAWFVGSTAPGALSDHTTEKASRTQSPLLPRAPLSSPNTVSSPDAQAEVVQTERAWVEQTAGLPTFVSAAAYDSARGRVVFLSETSTWEFDGTAWLNVTPPSSGPAPVFSNSAMAYDSRRGRTVLFTNRLGSSSPLTLEWDGQRWADVSPQSGGPSSTGGPMAYDSVRGRVVLYVGGASHETWEWDGTLWRDVTPLTGGPGALSGGRMTFDPGARRVVLVGGSSTPSVWAWDGIRWLNITPSGSAPAPRSRHAVAYDVARGRLVLFGGSSGLTTNLSDTWELDGFWRLITPTGARPLSRSNHAMMYDPVGERVIIVGGSTRIGSTFTSLTDTWTWDGAAWGEVTPPSITPDCRWGFGMAYDSFRQRTVVFSGLGGGTCPTAGQRFTTTFEWDGGRWLDVTPTTGSPAPRGFHAMAYDSARRRVVLFGGQAGSTTFGDTWEWDGAVWRNRTLSTGNPPARSLHAMAYDSIRQRVVMFGGGVNSTTFLSDTWEWDGVTWRNRTPVSGSPAARERHAMAWDSTRSEVVLYGGGRATTGTPFSDIWTWNGTSWRNRTPSHGGPPARRNHAMAYDRDQGRLVVVGGTNGSALRDTWAWDGLSWENLTPLTGGNPAAASFRYYHGMVYDQARKEVLLFGGLDSDDQLWAFLPQTEPDVQFSLQIPPDIEQENLTDIRVRAFCGGAYQSAGSPATGAQLRAWVSGGPDNPPGGFRVLASNGAGTSLASATSGLMDYVPSALSAATTAQSFFGPGRRMFFQCRPDGSSGTEFSEVALDYLEARIKYDARP